MAIEPDPVAALTARANLAVFGFADRAQVVSQDFRSLTLPPVQGPTLYVGNPPYVRHHLVEPKWKRWLTDEAARFGIQASQLAGLHVYFFLQVARLARTSDYGVFVTSAEWLDVNYGHTVRELFLNRLGGRSITLIEPEAMPFADAASTAVVTTFKVASQAPTSAKFARVASLDALGTLSAGRPVRRERLVTEKRWTHLTRPGLAVPSGYVELGELCRVHRGQVTGNNKVWIANEDDHDLPDDVLFPTVTKARDLIALKSGVLTSSKSLKRVIDLPSDLDVLGSEARRLVETFLKTARSLGAHTSYTARHRRAWWTVGLREPAPILATYMARRPPAFVLNQADARHINIAHGLYPRDTLSGVQLTRLTEYLRKSATQAGGRTYAGGLTKFEPREMERFAVPTPAMLEAGVH